MKNKSALKILSLMGFFLVASTSLVGCSNEPIKGPIGDPGPNGEDGKDGIDGNDGKDGVDGSTWLVGENNPTSNEGKEGDYYLNTSTNDLFKKTSSGWELISNLNGEVGENGSNGANGNNGKNVYSNTYLPISGGYVKANKGSTYVGDEITFTITPLDNKEVASLVLNDEIITVDMMETIDDRIYTYTTSMVENGFVVSANFNNFIPVKSINLSASSSKVKVGGPSN